MLLSGSAKADVRRLEVVGAVPAGADAPEGVPVRQAALQQALVEAVARVARDLWQAGPLPQPAPDRAGAATEPPREPADWIAALGGDAAAYAIRYRVLEDRGERRALLVRDPKVATEYELLVAVQVDAGRVARGLERAGLLLASRASGPRQQVRVVLTPLPSYEALSELRARLSAGGARPTTPVRFTADAAVLRVDSTASPDVLLDLLLEKPPKGVRVRPLAVKPHELRLEVVEEPLPGAAAIDTR